MTQISLDDFEALKASKTNKLSLSVGQVVTLVIKQADNLDYAEQFDNMEIVACDHTPGIEVAHLENAGAMITFSFLDLLEYGTVWYCI